MRGKVRNITSSCLKLNFLRLLSINVSFVYLFYLPFYVYNWDRVKFSPGQNVTASGRSLRSLIIEKSQCIYIVHTI